MATLTVSIPDELKKRMDAHPEIHRYHFRFIVLCKVFYKVRFIENGIVT